MASVPMGGPRSSSRWLIPALLPLVVVAVFPLAVLGEFQWDDHALLVGNDALTHLQQAIQIDPRSSIAHNSFGVALAHSGRVQEAVVHFQAATRAEPGLQEAHQNLAHAQRLLAR
jgi:tetratricopeptide (TPR) repeat protein